MRALLLLPILVLPGCASIARLDSDSFQIGRGGLEAFQADDSDCRVANGYRCFDGGGAIGKYCRHPQAGDACTTATDCGIAGTWFCKTGVQYPGGYCTPIPQCNATSGEGCTPGSSVCFDPIGADTPYCVDRCTVNGQGSCRTGYVCQMIGNARGCVPVVP